MGAPSPRAVDAIKKTAVDELLALPSTRGGIGRKQAEIVVDYLCKEFIEAVEDMPRWTWWDRDVTGFIRVKCGFLGQGRLCQLAGVAKLLTLFLWEIYCAPRETTYPYRSTPSTSEPVNEI